MSEYVHDQCASYDRWYRSIGKEVVVVSKKPGLNHWTDPMTYATIVFLIFIYAVAHQQAR